MNFKAFYTQLNISAWVVILGLLCGVVTAEGLPKQCESGCLTDYGQKLGESPDGVIAYSNCNATCVIFEPNYYQNIYTGIKWQCVEYARRWLLQEYELVFGDVDIASDIWNLEQLTNPKTGHKFKFLSIVNGAQEKPQRGDLLIYSKMYLGTGHVAVVVGAGNKQGSIRVAEQNYLNTKWKNNHAREISLIKMKERYWLLDPYLIGWKRVMNN